MGYTADVTRTEEHLAELLKLPAKDRARAANALLDSLEEEVESTEVERWERDWIDEINRRLAELDAGRARLIPAETVFAELREKFDGQAG